MDRYDDSSRFCLDDLKLERCTSLKQVEFLDLKQHIFRQFIEDELIWDKNMEFLKMHLKQRIFIINSSLDSIFQSNLRKNLPVFKNVYCPNANYKDRQFDFIEKFAVEIDSFSEYKDITDLSALK